MRFLILLAISALPLLAQDKDSTGGTSGALWAPAIVPPAAKPDLSISADLRAKYWRGQTELNLQELVASKAGLDLEHAREKGRTILAELTKACGANLPLKLDKDGEPACTANPPVPAEALPPDKSAQK